LLHPRLTKITLKWIKLPMHQKPCTFHASINLRRWHQHRSIRVRLRRSNLHMFISATQIYVVFISIYTSETQFERYQYMIRVRLWMCCKFFMKLCWFFVSSLSFELCFDFLGLKWLTGIRFTHTENQRKLLKLQNVSVN
jgi:hypothetical protein